MLHPCPLQGIRAPSSSPRGGEREGCCPRREGCSGSLRWESFPLRPQKARVGRAAQLWVRRFPRGAVCCCLPLPEPTPRSRCWGCASLLLPAPFTWALLDPRVQPPPPPPSLPPPAGCHPPSGSRAVQLSCDFAWARNVGPQLFWSRVGVVLSLARHPTTPLTAACLKEVGILCSSCRMWHCRTYHRADGTRACVSRSGFCLFSCVRCCPRHNLGPLPLSSHGWHCPSDATTVALLCTPGDLEQLWGQSGSLPAVLLPVPHRGEQRSPFPPYLT